MIITLPNTGGFDAWRERARGLLASSIHPAQVQWRDAAAPPSLLPDDEAVEDVRGAASPLALVRVPRNFLQAAARVACHRDPGRWALLYRLVWRVTHEGPALLSDPLDEDVQQFERMRRQVGEDEHRMQAYVRFRRVEEPGGERYVAWYAPEHSVLRLVVPFFVERFGSMRWSILTPQESAHWDLASVTFSAGVPLPQEPSEDQREELWRTYYTSVFNPARINLGAMRGRMPVKFWSNLPETRDVARLASDAGARVNLMVSSPARGGSARPWVPAQGSLEQLRAAIPSCEGCDLHAPATQAVFGEGPPKARIMLVGEQPGDQEDLAGRPFVGPAGDVLARALADAGIDRSAVYVTNAVKHFKFEPRGKRRIHQTPRLSEIRACRPWVEAEIHAVQPAVLVCLGATAAQALIGPQFRLTRHRGQRLTTPWADVTLATYHPSAILRADTPETSAKYYELLVQDLQLAAGYARENAARA
jgi:probable DNA metabolism protein